MHYVGDMSSRTPWSRFCSYVWNVSRSWGKRLSFLKLMHSCLANCRDIFTALFRMLTACSFICGEAFATSRSLRVPRHEKVTLIVVWIKLNGVWSLSSNWILWSRLWVISCIILRILLQRPTRSSMEIVASSYIMISCEQRMSVMKLAIMGWLPPRNLSHKSHMNYLDR